MRYAEAAAGVRWKPLAAVPVAINFERRQALNRWGGRNAFALFAEGGLYQTPVFGLGNLDFYAQGGMVGFKNRDLFFDGGATLTRPVWRKVSAGIGLWGGMQPGLYRIDAGPRLTYDVGRGIRLHADYRQRLAGEAIRVSPNRPRMERTASRDATGGQTDSPHPNAIVRTRRWRSSGRRR